MRCSSCNLEDLCRVCGCKLNKGSKALRKQAVVSVKLGRRSCAYKCTSFIGELLTAFFHFDASKDCPEIHPPMFCSKCQLVLSRNVAAQKEKRPYKCSLKPYDWFRWGVEECKVPLNKSSNCHKCFFQHFRVACLFIWIDGPNTSHTRETVLLKLCSKLWLYHPHQ